MREPSSQTVRLTEVERLARTLQEQNARFDVALTHMTQGLNMFDTAARLVLHNERYLQMYNLSPNDIKPGCTIRDLVQHRISAGTFFTVDPETYIWPAPGLVDTRLS